MASSYLEGSYATLNHDLYNSLTAYSKKIYMFLMSHENHTRQISLEKLRPLIGVNEDVTNDHFKKYINLSIKELKEKLVLDKSSKISKNILYTTVLPDAWEAKPIHVPKNPPTYTELYL